MIPLLLLAALMIGGCDKQSPAGSQANETIGGNAASDGAQNDVVVEEQIGTIVRDHAGKPAPDVAFESPAGARVTLASFRGKPVLLNLWATWCAPCIKEMPSLDALSGTLGDSVTVLAVSQDTKGAEAVDPFFQKAGFKRLQPYLDTSLALSTAMGGPSLPITILYDSQGKEVWRMLGGMDWTGETARELVSEAR